MASLYKKPVTIRDPKTGEKIKGKSKKWWGRYRDVLDRDRRIPLTTDKQAAQAMLSEIVLKVEREKAGLLDSVDEEMRRPITKHLADFKAHKKAKGNTVQYIKEVDNKLERIKRELKWRTLADIKATKVEGYLADLREEEGRSIQTSNHYLRALKGFTRWLVNNDRLHRDPLCSLSLLNTSVDRRHDRRPLSREEFMHLLEAAETGPPVESVSGRDRAMLYLLAAWTGLRKKELGSLTPRSLRLDTDPPTVKVAAGYSKRRREDVIILHPDIVTRLQSWLEATKPMANELLFPICEETGGIDRKASKMMEEDLAAARRAWLAESPDSKDRQQSDFLLYQDSDDKFADFHALRHTFVTNLCKANVSPKTAQTLARHSNINLTMNIYTHVDQEEQAAAINKLPGI